MAEESDEVRNMPQPQPQPQPEVTPKVIIDYLKPVRHASYDDFVKGLKYRNEQCHPSKSKIVGGLPLYGYSWKLSIRFTYPVFYKRKESLLL